METLSDIFQAIKLGITERITSPLLGTYLISWLVWNYRLLFVLFSDLPVAVKFTYIDSVLYPSIPSCISSFTWPAIATIFLIYGYPFLARYVYEHRLNVNRDLMARRQRVEDETPMTLEQGRNLRIAFRERENQFNVRIGELEQENVDMRAELRSKNNSPTYTKTPVLPSSNEQKSDAVAGQYEIGPLEITAFRIISNSMPDNVEQRQIINVIIGTNVGGKAVGSRVQILNALENLALSGLVTSEKQGSSVWYTLTKRGTDFALKNSY